MADRQTKTDVSPVDRIIVSSTSTNRADEQDDSDRRKPERENIGPLPGTLPGGGCLQTFRLAIRIGEGFVEPLLHSLRVGPQSTRPLFLKFLEVFELLELAVLLGVRCDRQVGVLEVVIEDNGSGHNPVGFYDHGFPMVVDAL